MHVCKWRYLHICWGRFFNCIYFIINNKKRVKKCKNKFKFPCTHQQSAAATENLCCGMIKQQRGKKKPTLLVLWPLHTSMRKYHKLNLFYVFFLSSFFIHPFPRHCCYLSQTTDVVIIILHTCITYSLSSIQGSNLTNTTLLNESLCSRKCCHNTQQSSDGLKIFM